MLNWRGPVPLLPRPIEKGAWRIALVFYEEGRFVLFRLRPRSLAREKYFETTDVSPASASVLALPCAEEDLVELAADL